MIREGSKLLNDSLHLRLPHSLKMELVSQATESEMTLSEFVLTQLGTVGNKQRRKRRYTNGAYARTPRQVRRHIISIKRIIN